jgi:hypothetical protein
VWLEVGSSEIDKGKTSIRGGLQEVADFKRFDKYTDYKIFETGMRVPLNKIVLIRKGQEIGAFKLTYCEEKSAQYEWYYPLQHGLDKVNSGKGTLRNRFVCVIGRLCFQLGNIHIKCGPLKIDWNGYHMVAFFGTEEESRNYSVELAPTNKEKIEEINLSDPKLKWYRYTEEKREITIESDEL